MQASDLVAITGQRLLFIGADSDTWTPAQFGGAAQFARAHGADTLLIKIADGGEIWHNGLDGWHAIRAAVLAEGVGAIPYMYSYGNKFSYLDGEIDILIQYMQDCSIVCMDAEEEWNGQVAWAQHLCSRIQPAPGTFLVSTWGNPSEQAWLGVIQALAPCTDVFMPQQYTDYLAGFWQEFGANGAAWLQPTVMLSQDFGPNDWTAIAQAAHNQGHTAISVWHYDLALANPAALDAVYAAFPKAPTATAAGEETTMLELTDPVVSQYFIDGGNGTWKCKTTGAVLQGENLKFYRNNNGLALFGLPLANEDYSVRSGTGDTSAFVECERAGLMYDPDRRHDNPPVAGPVYTIHVERDPRVTIPQANLKAAQAEIVQLQQQLTAAKAATPGSSDQINEVTTTLETIMSAAQASLHYLGKA